MATALDIITEAYQLLGVLGQGQNLSAANAQLGLTVLNDMLDIWSNESLTCFAIVEQSAPLVPGQQSYTIGTGGQFNMTRPIRLIEGPGAAYVQDANGNNYQMDVVPRNKWNMFGNRSNLVTSNFPDTLFYDPQYPLGIINVMPFPLLPYTMFWDSYLQLSDFATLATTVNLPPGYSAAIKANLAVSLHPYFLDVQISPIIVDRAMKQLGSIKRSNMRPLVAVYDPEIVSKSQVSYNPYTDRVGSTSS